MKPRVCVAIQARMSSNRLPGKVMREISGVKIIDSVLERVSEVVGKEHVYVLTSTETSDDILASYLQEKDVNVFRGSLENVLLRFSSFAKEVREKYDYIGRVCADSPFIDSKIMTIIHESIQENFDFVTTRYIQDGEIFSNVPKGKNYEVVSCKSLASIDAVSMSGYEREHVIPAFFREEYSYLSVTNGYFETLTSNCAIDTIEDLEAWNLK